MEPRHLWEADHTTRQNSHLTQYINWLNTSYRLNFSGDYEQLHQWSIDHVEVFWESIWKYFNVINHRSYDRVTNGKKMPYTRWFLNSQINYAEHIFRNATDEFPALISKSETRPTQEVSWQALEAQTAHLREFFKESGIQTGDRIVGFLPNIPEATVSFLATNSLGAIWSCCSPDFGIDSILDRFSQINPKILIAVDGYQYGGKPFDRMEVIAAVKEKIPSLEKVIIIPYLSHEENISSIGDYIHWNTIFDGPVPELRFTPVDFNHPMWVLYSSGTTGNPKAITHSHGGMLLEHFKYLAFHNDVHRGERFFWYTTTGWMMWNFVQASLLCGATAVLYDGNPAFPNLEVLWDFAEKAEIHHFGTSAPYIVACMKADIHPGRQHTFKKLRSIGSTGAPLPPEAFDWIYGHIKKDVWLCSMSGGTDVCTAFVGGCLLKPVIEGYIQCRALGVAMYAYDDDGQIVWDETGEMVITQPMPAMPIYFWNDKDHSRYLESYFEQYPEVWRHGDWVEFTRDGMLRILGRSDATLNRHGVRIGTAEIYRVIDTFEQVEDSLVVNLEYASGDHFMPIFLKMKPGHHLSDELIRLISQKLRSAYSPRHIPDRFIRVEDIPYTISGKKMEGPVKKILLGKSTKKSLNRDAMRNPESLEIYETMAQQEEFQRS